MLVQIRRANVQDASVLSKLAASTFFDTFTGTCGEEDMEEFLINYFSIQQVEKELKDSSDFYYLAEKDQKVVGYMRLKEDYSHFEMMKQWRAIELKRIYVDKDYHGKGVAQTMIDFAFNFSQINDYEVIWLGVWEHNLRAQKFYLKNGFENTGHTHDFPIGNTPQTDYWFWKFF